jgi:hypothetical protein
LGRKFLELLCHHRRRRPRHLRLKLLSTIKGSLAFGQRDSKCLIVVIEFKLLLLGLELLHLKQ